ncbi:YciI family protein [Kutzneria buriramensis]|uniref:YCII-related domain-containing protein n=1 Tax=Kutzneria buriramensis TaxID=1045776 RepID=A0A3E0HLF7_9PSEU|nr:YciI family protein [Kutzneria buriramensis]REH47218.1 hypothetical protein BCF44_106383 [Kutzneria buriramensis]
MRHLMLIRLDPATAPSAGPDPALADSMERLLEEMTEAGVLLETAGLRPIEEATRIYLAKGRTTVRDGPFTESKEIVGGYCLLDTRSHDEAVEWSTRFLALHGPAWTIELEIRQLDE